MIFKRMLVIDGWDISCETALGWMSLDLADDKSALVSGNGFVPSANKKLPETMLTLFSVAIWRR